MNVVLTALGIPITLFVMLFVVGSHLERWSDRDPNQEIAEPIRESCTLDTQLRRERFNELKP